MKKPEHTIATLEQFMLPSRRKRLADVAANRTRSLTIVLDRVQKFHNISAVLRSADAFGLTTVHLVGERFEYNRSIARGTERWLELVPHSEPAAAIAALKNQGFEIVILQPPRADDAEQCKVIPVTELPFEKKLALVFGNELRGVGQEFIDAATYRAYVPMYGFVESFNISVAAAICLFCSTIARTEPKRRAAPISTDEQNTLLAGWLTADVRGASLILEEVALREEEA